MAAVAGSVTTLSGCLNGDGGDGDDGNESNGPGDDSEIVDTTYTSLTVANPMEVDYNPFTPSTDAYTIGPMSNILMHYTRVDPTWVPIGARDWELDEEEEVFRIELNDSITWHDGTDFTAEDVQFAHQLSQYMQAGDHFQVYDYAESVEVADTHTVEYNLDAVVSENAIMSAALYQPFYQHQDDWAEYWEAFEDATTDEELQDVRSDVLEFRQPNPTTNGPLELVNRTEQGFEFEVYEDWPWDDVQQQFTDTIGEDITDWGRPNFETVHYKWAPDHQRLAQEWTGDNVSGGIPGGDLEEQQLNDDQELIQISSLYGTGLMWNLWDESGDPPGDEAWQDINVRKAFAHIIDRQAVGDQYNTNGATPEKQTGLVEAHQEQWLDEEFMEQLQAHDQDFDRARELLEEADYYEEDGTWYKPNGEELVADFHTAASVNFYVRGFEVATDNLDEFGITTEMRTTEGSTFFDQPYPHRDYQVSTPGFFGGANPSPIRAYEFVYERPSYLPEGADADEREYYMTETIGESFEVPPVGEPDAEPSMEVNPHELIEEFRTTTNEDRRQEIIETLAWATNWFVPKIEVTETVLLNGINRDGWNYPDSDSMTLQLYWTAPSWWQLGTVDAEQ